MTLRKKLRNELAERIFLQTFMFHFGRNPLPLDKIEELVKAALGTADTFMKEQVSRT